MSNIRPKFTKEEFNKVLRELCSESRQKIWKKNPQQVFEINGKKLMKQEEKQILMAMI